MERRKFLIGAGSLAAGSAAAVGTGAFTSVSADRSLDVSVADDADALLKITDGAPENDEYVDTSGDAVSITIESDEGGEGLNNDATTKIKNLLQITNQGTQNVYVYATGLPQAPGGGKVALGTQASSDFQNMADSSGREQGENSAGAPAPTGPGGGLSTNAGITESDLPDDDASTSGEAAPLLAPGDYVDVELFAYTDLTGLDFSDDITINAVAESEV